MGNLLSGLENFGLDNVKEKEIFGEEAKKEPVKMVNKQETVFNEADVIFDKTYTCPVCDTIIKSKTVKAGKVKLLSVDSDLRPKYQQVDSLKYDAILCNRCGYAALNRYFSSVTAIQAKAVKEQITKNYKANIENKEIFSYDDALLRHKMALANAMVAYGKNSEKAYICLKLAWLYRGMQEQLVPSESDYQSRILKLKENEEECIVNAYEGFKAALSKESFPMCGMDEMTMMYLMAELARRCKRYDESMKLVSKIFENRFSNDRIKEKARVIKERILEERKA